MSPTRMLDLDDFMGISFTTGPDGKVYQPPGPSSSPIFTGSATTGSSAMT